MENLKFLLLFSFWVTVSSTWSQNIEITPSYGFQFSSKLNYDPIKNMHD